MVKKILTLALAISLHSACKETDSSANQEKNNNWQLTGFVKIDSLNPILLPNTKSEFFCPISQQTVHWEARNVLNPCAIVKDSMIYLIYRAQDQNMTSRLGLATSIDGLHFTKLPEPIFFPNNDSLKKFEWRGGVEDPRIVMRNDGTYILTYTSYDGKTARLCVASSKDLVHWTKYGSVFTSTKYADRWSKSGAIVVQQIGSQLVAVKINGKYWMYFGDTYLFAATSIDLIHWDVLENVETQKAIEVLNPRPGFFDSRLVEPGPFALLKKDGILLIYNSSNAANYNDIGLAKYTYSAGQALFQKDLPFKLIKRSDHFFLTPDKPYEKVGEVNNVCFVEGLVNFNTKWFLYYGTADAKIAVAVKNN